MSQARGINITYLAEGRVPLSYGLTTNVLERRRELNRLLDELMRRGVAIGEPHLNDLRTRLPLETPCQELRLWSVDWSPDVRLTLLDLREVADTLPGQGHLSAFLTHLDERLERLPNGLYLVLPYQYCIKAFALRVDNEGPGGRRQITAFYTDIETKVDELLQGASLPVYLLTAASANQ